jgi:hypothetical protein
LGTEEFLACLSRAALEAEASRHRVLPRSRVKDTRAALVEQVRETRLVLPAAQFALTEQESSDLAKKGSRYAYDDEVYGENEDGETTATPIPPEDTDLDHDDGDVDQIAAPEIEAADHADTGYEPCDEGQTGRGPLGPEGP